MREALIAAVLTGMMILLFLGSWRSTLIVCISIPLSILSSLCILSLLGQTINVMTLGGLALAVGILVDDATVEIENTHRNLAMRKPLIRAVLDGAGQIAVPTFVATLSICIVFVPVLLLTGTARYLFTPLAMAVVFAMLASYFLSRTLVPTMVAFLLKSEVDLYQHGAHGETAGGRGLFWRVHYIFNKVFERLRYRYVGLLDWSLRHRAPVLTAFMCLSIASLGLVWLVGEDFFPDVDSGQMRLHVRAPAGTRIEQTEVRFGAIEREIRDIIPADEIDTLIDNIGIPNSWTSIAQGDIPTISSADGEILISLKKEKHGSTRDYEVILRKRLLEKFPDTSFFFQPANITTQILSFGLPAPIDLQVVGRDKEANYKIAQKLATRIAHIPGAADVHVHQVVDQPLIGLNVDRVKAAQLGLTQRDVTSSMLISLSGNSAVAPNFWVNWDNGVNYNVGVQTPQYRIDSLDALMRTPISVATSVVTSTTQDSQAGASGGGNASIGNSPSGMSQAYGNPGAMIGQHAIAIQPGHRPPILRASDHQPLQRPGGFRCVRQRRPARSGRRRSRSSEDHARRGEALAARHHLCAAGPDRNHAIVLLPPGIGHGVRRRAGLSSDGGEFSVLARSVHHSDRAAGRDGRNFVDAVRYRHHAQRAVSDGRSDVYRRGHRQQYFDGHFCQ